MDELISTELLQQAADYVDKIIETVREAHAEGADLDVETLTAMMMAGIEISGVDSRTVVAQQAVMLSITIHRLAR